MKLCKIISLILANQEKYTLVYGDLFANLIAANTLSFRYSKVHPATKTFQGIRTAINSELDALCKALPVLLEKLCIDLVSYHFICWKIGLSSSFSNE
jgi:16S rRNA C1402 N4-methylase RsmH